MSLSFQEICLLVFVGFYSVSEFIPERVLRVIAAIAGIVYVVVVLIQGLK